MFLLIRREKENFRSRADQEQIKSGARDFYTRRLIFTWLSIQGLFNGLWLFMYFSTIYIENMSHFYSKLLSVLDFCSILLANIASIERQDNLLLKGCFPLKFFHFYLSFFSSKCTLWSHDDLQHWTRSSSCNSRKTTASIVDQHWRLGGVLLDCASLVVLPDKTKSHLLVDNSSWGFLNSKSWKRFIYAFDFLSQIRDTRLLRIKSLVYQEEQSGSPSTVCDRLPDKILTWLPHLLHSIIILVSLQHFLLFWSSSLSIPLNSSWDREKKIMTIPSRVSIMHYND